MIVDRIVVTAARRVIFVYSIFFLVFGSYELSMRMIWSGSNWKRSKVFFYLCVCAMFSFCFISFFTIFNGGMQWLLYNSNALLKLIEQNNQKEEGEAKGEQISVNNLKF